MKFECYQNDLKRGLDAVSRAVAGRSVTLPVLSYIMLSADNGKLKIAATNLEIGSVAWIDATVETPGAITVPARTFADLVNALSDDKISFELSVRTQTLHLKCGRSEANVKGIDAAEFPLIPDPGRAQIQIEPDVLKKMINQVAFAAATNESRLTLTGVLTKFDNGKMTMAAVDGFRIATRCASVDFAKQRQILIPSSALIELARRLDQSEPVGVSFTDKLKQVIFSLDGGHIIAQLIDLQFPDYEAIIPKKSTTSVTVNTKALLKACRAANIFAREAANMVRFSVIADDAGRIEIAARSDETGSNAGEIDAKVDGDGLLIGLNIRYLLDVLSAIDTEQVMLKMTTPHNPILIEAVGDSDYVHVVMPMQMGK